MWWLKMLIKLKVLKVYEYQIQGVCAAKSRCMCSKIKVYVQQNQGVRVVIQGVRLAFTFIKR